MRRFLSRRENRLPDSARPSNAVAPEDAPARLSLVMLVREPAQQVAAIAGLFLGVADEIIIAVDSRVEPASLGPLLDVATRVLRVEHTPPFANSAAWLHAQAKGRWVLVVDGDEVPSAALLRRLSRLDALDDYATHAHVARRWLWPDSSHYLASDPWRENPALRLTPGDKRLVTWHRQLHDQVRVDGPGVYLPECLYHLDTLSSLDSRRQKVQRYDKLRGDRLPGLAGTVNAAWYLPEDRPEALHVLPVPEDDQALLDAVSAAARKPTTLTAGLSLELVNRQEVESVVEGGPLDGRIAAAHVALRTAELAIDAGAGFEVHVEVRNDGEWTWRPWDGTRGVRLGWHWLHADGSEAQHDAGRGELTCRVPPGERVLVPIVVVAPAERGQYRLSVDLVDEHVQWFERAARMAVDVRAGAPLTLPPAEAELLATSLTQASVVLEYGSGGSTLLALEHSSLRVMTVETDAAYLARVTAAVPDQDLGRLRAVHVDLGPTREWGFPADTSRLRTWHEYVVAPWRELHDLGWQPDLVLVDGRFRAAAFLESLSRLAPGSAILFDDFHDRPHYWSVLSLLQPHASAGRMARFVVPRLTQTQRERIAALLPGLSVDPS